MIDKNLLNAKLRASGIHLGASAILFIILASIIAFLWYPTALFTEAGGWQGLKLIAAVDLVLGPFLTFIIFNPAKTFKALKFDYSFILIAQLGAVTWGMYATYTQHPAALVYYDNKFQAITQDYYDQQQEDWLLTEAKGYADYETPMFYVREAVTDKEQAGVFSWEFVEGVPEQAIIFLYSPVRDYLAEISNQHQKNLAQLAKEPARQSKFDTLLAEQNQVSENVILSLFEGRYGNTWIVFDKNGGLLGFI